MRGGTVVVFSTYKQRVAVQTANAMPEHTASLMFADVIQSTIALNFANMVNGA